MDVYIDLDNLYSYACKGGSEHFLTCNELLRKNFNIHFTFSKEALGQSKKKVRDAIMTLLKSLTRNRGTRTTDWESLFPARPFSDSFYETLTQEQLMSMYWLSDDQAQSMEHQGCLLISSVGNELNTLLQLFIDHESLPTKQYPTRQMKDWSVLRNNSLPCTDIIVIDPFFFAQSDMLYERNSYKVLEELACHVKNKAIKIVIFTNGQNRAETGGYIDVPIPLIQRQIKERIKEKCGAEPFVTIVKLPMKEEHDRTIITNYKMFVSGDSFKYFDQDGNNTTHGRWLSVSSHAHDIALQLSMDVLKDLQSLADRQKSGLMNIIGDKKSNFIDFS